jgi:predicted double-glycine peptidase
LAERSDLGAPSVIGYGLIWLHRGTRLARLYSLAVHPDARGMGVAQHLLSRLETIAAEQQRLFMRLEVAVSNRSAIALYEQRGYRRFGEYSDYYADHDDALRMQKTIRRVREEGLSRPTPWYQQSTDFTCGPAALMMAMASLSPATLCEQALELDIWREATTIFMTSGHGGCHPLGLALAASVRGFTAEVCLSTELPLFVDGVRSVQKKQVMALVHEQFVKKCQQQKVALHYQELTQFTIEQWLQSGYAVLVLISTYRLDGKKAPHWVVVTGMDESCLYVHDPDLETETQLPIDCQHIPIARSDFEKMAAFGANRLRTAVAIKPYKTTV